MVKLHLLYRLLKFTLFWAFLSCTFSLVAQTGTIGNRVWNDNNSNGLQDNGESGMSGVFVILQNANGVDLDFDVTNQSGTYSFTVAPGTYRLKFANPGGNIAPSPQNQGNNDNNDSDANFLGFTQTFSISAGETDNSWDAGFGPPPPPCEIIVDVLDIECDDNGTPVNANDDQFYITLVLTGGNPWGWSGGGQDGEYGVPTTFGPFSINAGVVCLDFMDMDNPTCIGDICVDPPEPCSEPCDNITDGGKIGNDQVQCGPYNPSTIIQLEPATGGTGDIEYMWLASKNGCPTSITQRIFGATGASYDPPMIFQTMYYVRWARRADCPMWTLGKSNCVVKEVTTEECEDICESRMVMNASVCGTSHQFALHAPGILLSHPTISDYYHITEGQLTEFPNGTARLLARLKNNTDSDIYFDVEVNLSGRLFHPQPGSPNPSDCYPINDSDWYYYSQFNGTLTGHGSLEGGRLQISGSGSLFQLGTGANLHNLVHFGASTDLDYTVISHPDADIAFYKHTDMSFAVTLTGGVTNCIPNGNGCENDNVLFVVGNTNLDQSDAAVRAHLISTGYDVTLQKDHLAQPWDAMGFGLVIISASASAAHLDGTFKDVEVPVMTWDAWLYADMAMSLGGPNYGAVSGGMNINIHNDDHAISAGRLGVVNVYNLARPIAWGVPIGGGTTVAVPMMNPGKYAVFAYDQDDVMANGNTAPARRVGFFLGDQAAHRLTDEGWNLFDASVAWAIDCRLTTETFPLIGNQSADEKFTESPLDQKFASNFDLTPNPATTQLNIDLSDYQGDAIQITIVNHIGMTAQYVELSEVRSSAVQLNVNDLAEGVYFVKIESLTTNATGTKQFLIRK